MQALTTVFQENIEIYFLWQIIKKVNNLDFPPYFSI